MPTAHELDRILDQVPELAGRPRRIDVLDGGLTNRNYKVTTNRARYVVRCSSVTVGLDIDRDHEHANSRAAAAAGVGADVIAYLPHEHVMIVSWIDGDTCTDASFAQPGLIPRVAQACRRLHDGPRFGNDFDMFDVQRRYLDVVQRNGFRLPERYLEFAPQVALLERALAVRAEATVPCHNDLLAGNLIDDATKVWLIDYEYGGNNDACFELGNLWSECHLSLDQLAELLEVYYGRSSRNKLARAQLLGLMSKYGWTLWASIQAARSTMDFDFWTWGMEKYDSAVDMFTGAGFDRLVEDAQRSD